MKKNIGQFITFKGFKNYLFIIFPVVSLIIFSSILQYTVASNPQKITQWLSSFGPWFIIVYIIVQSITLLIPPLGGGFIWLGMIAIVGPLKGVALGYLVSTPIFCLNFILAKKYGRPLVERVVGKKGMEKIDRYATDVGTQTLLILRMLQGGYFDYISYAVGLTKISFRKFFLITAVGGIPANAISYFVLSTTKNLFYSLLLLQLVTAVLLGISVLYNRHRKK